MGAGIGTHPQGQAVIQQLVISVKPLLCWRPLENAFHQVLLLPHDAQLLDLSGDHDLVTNHHEHLHGSGSAYSPLGFWVEESSFSEGTESLRAALAEHLELL